MSKPLRIHINEKGKVDFGAQRMKDVIRSSDEGYYMVKIEEWTQARTNLQNAFMHVCFDVYGKEMGIAPDESKFLLKKKFGCNHIIKDPETGDQHLFIKRTRNYTIEEGRVFIDRLLRHFEFECNIIIDSEIRKQYKIDERTGELEEIHTN